MEELHKLIQQLEKINADWRTVIENNERAKAEGDVFWPDQEKRLIYFKERQKAVEAELKSLEAFLKEQ